MVSIRRQRLIKLYGRPPSLEDLSTYENGQSPGSWWQNTNSVGMQHLSSVNQPNEEITNSEEHDSSIVSESNTSNNQPVLLPEIKRRKRHRRKIIESQEQCIMRGVYYKNMKWQAAIKVDKKQIHLGTVGSQEEAARLYDRAAYLCGREPNFDLTIEEKEELSKLSWDDFMTMTRSAIYNKKSQRRVTSRMKFENFQPNNSGSEMEGAAEAQAVAQAHTQAIPQAHTQAVAQAHAQAHAQAQAQAQAVAQAVAQAQAHTQAQAVAQAVAQAQAVAEPQAEADQGRNGLPGFDGADILAAYSIYQ